MHPGGNIEDSTSGYVDVNLVALVNLRRVERLLVDGQCHGESGSFALGALALDVAAVQIDQFASQGKSQTGSHRPLPTVVAVVESVEQFFHLFLRNTDAVIAYLNYNMVVLFVGVHL